MNKNKMSSSSEAKKNDAVAVRGPNSEASCQDWRPGHVWADELNMKRYCKGRRSIHLRDYPASHDAVS